MKLTEHDARCIRADNRWPNEIARDYGVSPTTIRDIKRWKTWRNVPQMPWYPDVSAIVSEMQQSDIYSEMSRYRPTCYDEEYGRQMRRLSEEMIEFGEVRAHETKLAIMAAQHTDIYVHEMRRGDEIWYVRYPQEVWRLDACVAQSARECDRALERRNAHTKAQMRYIDMLRLYKKARQCHDEAIIRLSHGDARAFFEDSGIKFTEVYHGLIAHPTTVQQVQAKLRLS